jgi:hypothetical protein
MQFTRLDFGLGVIAGIGATLILMRGRRMCRNRRFMPDPSILPDAIPHLVYEYSNFVHAAKYVVDPENKGGPVSVHVGDVFLLNCRKMGDFFSTRATDRPDVRAVHFCTQDPLPALPLLQYRRWKLAMDQNLAHISYKRVTKPIVFYDTKGRSRVNALMREIQLAFRLFLDHIDDEHRLAFESELSNRRIVLKDIELP